MKKIKSLFIVLATTLLISSCGVNEHMVVLDSANQFSLVEDNSRVYYEIFVGAFSDSNNDGMGDLRGIINRLDYLNDGNPGSGKSLGIEGIWLMPIMRSPSYHKYDVIDYMSIDPKYGNFDDFKELTAKAKERGIDIIIDLVLNHTSNFHDWFRAARKAVNEGDMTNKYIEYYTLVTEEQKVAGRRYFPFAGDLYYEGNFSDSMPELNMDSELVRNEIKEIIKFWFDLGVHGFRLDATKYIYLNETRRNLEFWNWFMDEVRAIKPDAYVVGETWSSDILMAPYYEAFSNFDFGMSQSSGAIAAAARGYDSVNSYVRYLNSYRNLITSFNPNAILTPFISNHDHNRAAGYLSLDDHVMHMAATLYIWTYGTPFMYYGEEIGLLGSRGSENTDANRRLKMLWGDNDRVSNPIGATFEDSRQVNGSVKTQLADKNSLLNHYKKIIMLRNANPEIGRGAYTPIIFEGFYSFGGFISTYKNSSVGVFHNTGDTQISIDLSKYSDHRFNTMRGYAGKGKAEFNSNILILDPMTSVILK
jgi:alpha-amylase